MNIYVRFKVLAESDAARASQLRVTVGSCRTFSCKVELLCSPLLCLPLLLTFRKANMGDKKGQLYVVDDVLACKRVGGKFYYRIRWSGYGAADDTWEGKECFTAGSLSHFRPRLDALEQLWLNSGAEKRRKQNASTRQTSAPSRRRARGTKTKKSPKKASGTKKSQPAKPKMVKGGNKNKNTRTKGRRGRAAAASK